MTLTRHVFEVSGTDLEVQNDGTGWTSPHDGKRHPDIAAAMRSELEHLFQSIGENPQDEMVRAEIEFRITESLTTRHNEETQ